MANEEIRGYARMKGVALWRLADKYGICENSMARRLRHEFTESEKTAFRGYVDQIAKEVTR